ncbi:MAG: amidase [Acidimicrobiia bacterium]|jgi:aspartyl-tRNA(Asn)/glutamyl-tRNA(Gln) amidotransferase subunit A|nr:amidase [Acidimicrobiia bacterium]
MTAEELRFESVLGLAGALRDGRTTSVELVEAYLAAADRLDPTLGTYLARFDDSALKAAAEADAERAAGRERGPLHGIPVGVKDILATDEGPTTAQSLVLDPSWGEQGDGPVVTRLREAGAIVLGKTTTMEFAIGYPDRSKPFPVPTNPWNTDHWTGGSSSGTGNGIAAGLFPTGLGTDTGGSIRIPAAYCGVSGHKPTFGLVPKSGCVPLGFSYDHIGPLARTAADCAAVLDVIAGPDPSDPTSAAVRGAPVSYLDRIDAGVKGLRVGVVRSVTADGPFCEPGVRDCFDRSLDDLAKAGARLEEIEFPWWNELHDACFLGLQAEAFAWHRSTLQTRWEDYGYPTRLTLAHGALISGADYAQSQRVRRTGRRAVGALFDEVDVLVLPTAGSGAPSFRHASDISKRLQSIFTPPFNALGFPALSVPMGFDPGGLPTSLQIVAPPFADALALRVGHAYQQVTDWHRQVPPLAR